MSLKRISITIVAVALSLVLGLAGSAWALDDEQAAQAAKTRQSVLTVIRWNVVPMAAMVKERIPYDAERFRLHAGRVAYMSTMLADAFRPDTREHPVETEALDKIWDEFDEFVRLAEATREKADALNNVAMGDDFAAIQASFLELGQTCGDCHDKFREDDD